MAKYYTTNTLIDSIKRRAMLPETQVTFKDPDFLAFANEEMDIGLVPHILSFHEDYLLVTARVPFERGVNRYEIPDRAIGNKLREIQYEDVNGGLYELTRIFIEDVPYFQNTSSTTLVRSFYTEGNEIVLMPEMDQGFQGGTFRVSYYIRPSELVAEDRVAKITNVDVNRGLLTVDAIPEVFADGPLLDITAARSPFKILGLDLSPLDYGSTFSPIITMGTTQKYELVAVAPASIIDSSYLRLDNQIDGNANLGVIWFDKTGSSTAPSVGDATLYRVDISAAVTADDVATAIKNTINPISIGNIVAVTSTSTVLIESGGIGINVGPNYQIYDGNSGLVITETQVGTNIIPRHVKIGDIVSSKEETIIPQVPLELHSILAQRAALRCLEALGDQQGLQAAYAKLTEMETKAGSLIDNRVEGAPLKVAPKNTFLRRGRIYLRR